MKKIRQQNAITLVALVITIIILLILAGISISALTNQGLFGKAQQAKQESENAQREENEILANYLDEMNAIAGGSLEIPETPEPPEQTSPNPTEPAKTVFGAQSDYMLTKTVNSQVHDEFGNKITVPAGFKIKVDSTTNNATTVDKGIVIIDSNQNEFVWVPTGKIYTDTARTEAKAKTIDLNRYEFNASGVATPKNDGVVLGFHYEYASSTWSGINALAKNLNAFKTKASATGSGGFYIGRYEARKNSSGVITEKGTDTVWTNITQPNASTKARNMYNSTKPFESDLINSYAWDTATIFLRECGINSSYATKTSVNSSLAATGTNNQTIKDVQCNVYDMASNVYEWTTETRDASNQNCVYRGGSYTALSEYPGYRDVNRCDANTYSYDYVGFRPILYL